LPAALSVMPVFRPSNAGRAIWAVFRRSITPRFIRRKSSGSDSSDPKRVMDDRTYPFEEVWNGLDGPQTLSLSGLLPKSDSDEQALRASVPAATNDSSTSATSIRVPDELFLLQARILSGATKAGTQFLQVLSQASVMKCMGLSHRNPPPGLHES